MSVSSQENKSQNFLVEQAIAEGIRQVAEFEPEQEIAIELNRQLGEKIIELTSVLTLSTEILLESAISYFHYQYKKNPDFAQKWQNYYHQIINQSNLDLQKKDRTVVKKITLAAEILYKLEEMHLSDNIQECVYVGIHLLHNKLIN